jgi:ketosteroid isomerase-like protein
VQSAEEVHLGLIKSLLRAFATMDIPAVQGLMTEDVRFHFPGNNAFSGEYKGREQAMRLLARAIAWTRATTRVQIHDALANEQHGLLLYTVTARRGDKSITYRYMDVYHFREGRISEVWGYAADNQAEFDAFYSE